MEHSLAERKLWEQKGKRGSANGNRTRFSPVQFGSAGSKCLHLRSLGTTGPSSNRPRKPDVVTRLSLASRMMLLFWATHVVHWMVEMRSGSTARVLISFVTMRARAIQYWPTGWPAYFLRA